MKPQNNKYTNLRREFSFLSFDDFSISNSPEKLEVVYHFNLSDRYFFKPSFAIAKNKLSHHNISESLLNNLIFHIGMAEMISYWKTACPPRLIVRPFSLDAVGSLWWKNLYFHGLGEFFYTNGINPDFEDFLSFESYGPALPKPEVAVKRGISLIPVGGGKDSVVSLEILALENFAVMPMYLNPTRAALEVGKTAGYNVSDSLIVQRILDPLLLELNSQGFLNGHTPFSAMLAFYSLLAAAITGAENILLSNESSASEPTIPGTLINHQYSKSFGFESDFRDYYSRFIGAGFNYFSFLRNLSELQIAAVFSTFEKYHSVFRSCNAGSKQGVWCCNCAKCLFTFTILSPFLETDRLLKIFGENLFEKPALRLYFDQLCGLADEKPFDCIGTVDEVNIALQMTVNRYKTNKLPLLLEHYKSSAKYKSIDDEEFMQHLKKTDPAHFIPAQFQNIQRKHF